MRERKEIRHETECGGTHPLGNRCQFYSHSPYFVCAVHPTGPDLDRCPDFQPAPEQEVEEL